MDISLLSLNSTFSLVKSGVLYLRAPFIGCFFLVEVLSIIILSNKLQLENSFAWQLTTTNLNCFLFQSIFIYWYTRLTVYSPYISQITICTRIIYITILCLNSGQSKVNVSYSPPSPQTFEPYLWFWKKG